MDDLRALGSVLTKPDPSTEMIGRSRQRLRTTMRGPARRPRTRLLAGGLGLTAAAAAATVVIASQPTTPTPTPNSPPAQAALSGRQVLLAAATSAEAKPASSGTYWHVKKVSSVSGKHRTTFETWSRKDGMTWMRDGSGPVKVDRSRKSFVLGRTRYTFAQLQRLPTDPGKLKAKARDPQNTFEGVLIYNLDELLYDLPVPPKVRAAAFRALAVLPDITNLGKVRGGQHLRFSIDGAGTDMIVDPKTTNVSDGGFTDFGGDRKSMGTFTWTSGWTNVLPR